MTEGYLDTGRTNQKWRTREALMQATNALIREGKTPTVTDAADAARVARTTAYRYFPTQNLLLAGAALYASSASPGMGVDLVAGMPGTTAERVDAVVRADWENTLRNEVSFRVYLSAAMRDGAGTRPANRVRWFSIALEEAKSALPKAEFRRLVSALSLCVGTESLVTLKDVCGLSADEALDVKLWAAQALVAAALGQKKSTGSAPKRSARAH